MSLQDTIDFGRTRFGTEVGLPPEAGSSIPRPGVPDWLLRFPGERFGEVAIVALTEEMDDVWIAPDVTESADASVNMPGGSVDAIAFYLPFHFYPTRWGIYYRESGLLDLAEGIKGAPLNGHDSSVLALALRLLYDHERFHFQAEIAATRVEVTYGKPKYAAYFQLDDAALLEEALANAQAYKALLRTGAPESVGRVRQWMLGQGAGYKDFELYVGRADHLSGRRRLGAHMPRPSRPPSMSAGAVPLDFLFPYVGSFRVPQYVVRDSRRTILQVVKRFPKAFGMQVQVHTNEHEPPHFHIYAPPGTFLTRYRWPELVPIGGDTRLSGRLQKGLEEYLAEHGVRIRDKLEVVYGRALPDLTPTR